MRRKANKYVKFSSLGIQMGLIIFIFTKGGLWLDDYYHTKTPWYTVALSLTGSNRFIKFDYSRGH